MATFLIKTLMAKIKVCGLVNLSLAHFFTTSSQNIRLRILLTMMHTRNSPISISEGKYGTIKWLSGTSMQVR